MWLQIKTLILLNSHMMMAGLNNMSIVYKAGTQVDVLVIKFEIVLRQEEISKLVYT